MIHSTMLNPTANATQAKARIVRVTIGWISLLHLFVELPAGDQRFILSGLVPFQFFQRHAPGEYRDIHGEFFGPQVGIEEMHGKDEARGQQRLVAVNDGCDVEERTRDKSREEHREPQREAGGTDDRDSPEHREIVEFFPVRPAAIGRPLAQADKPLQRAYQLSSGPFG